MNEGNYLHVFMVTDSKVSTFPYSIKSKRKKWKNEDEIVKLQWKKLADQKKLKHMQLYPDYKYRPQTAKKQKNRNKKRNNSNQIEVEPTLCNSDVIPTSTLFNSNDI
ncbi:1618_t:CDS:2 [Cetraspora pellucida]|uniref:1618_t:CDS:1 n=1 Tax=Cetraspora pellucida TaxID=1433469 RepID=A0ACA9NEC0_9GLOM|nr:1618_t:CDS:2 [Cetraspora pellucida]